jgi:serine/threonine protein kinase
MEHICQQVGRQNSSAETNTGPSQDPRETIDLSDMSRRPPQFGPQNHLTRDSWKMVSTEVLLFKLQSFFFCLCMALRYIHTQDIRHKDIKPENVLVDGSLSPILADFGLAACFRPGDSHVTTNGPRGTVEYAAPETADKGDHDDSTDVFSLGCVFTEIATVLLGKTLIEFKERRTVRLPAVCIYYSVTQPLVLTWIEALKNAGKGLDSNAPAAPGSKKALLETFTTIKEMLSLEAHIRPLSKDLPQKFSKVSAVVCSDCDGKNPWRPSQGQQKAEEERRRSREKGPLETLHEHPSKEMPTRTLPPRDNVASSSKLDPQPAHLQTPEPRPESVMTSASTASMLPAQTLERANLRPPQPGDNDKVYLVDMIGVYNCAMKFSSIRG